MAERKKKKKNFSGRFNTDEMVRFLLTNPVRGTDGVFVAIREAINNSIDAGATKVYISFGILNGKYGLIIEDNGRGLNREGINSFMSYAYSSRDRSDITTIGTNGTGVKHFIGLGNLEKTKITMYSLNESLSDCMKMELTYEYLLAIAKKKGRADDHVESTTTPDTWTKNLKRTTGATLHFTGFNKAKVKDAEAYINELSRFISPRSAPYVMVQDAQGMWQLIKPFEFEGTKLLWSDTSKTLGKVDFEVFYAGNGDGPEICGPVNNILPLHELVSKMGQKQRRRVSKIFGTISGNIYIENGNTFRLHDGSFNDKFYGKPCEEFLVMLELVGEELEKLTKPIKESQQQARKQKLISDIIEAGRKINPPAIFGGVQTKATTEKTDDHFIVPRRVEIMPEQRFKITLHDRYKGEPFSFKNTTWSCEGAAVTILNQKDDTATIVAGKSEGIAWLEVRSNNAEFEPHTISVKVTKSPPKPYIFGLKIIKPGDMAAYELKRYNSDEVSWKLEPSIADVTLHRDQHSKKNVTIEVGKKVPEKTTFSLIATHNGSIITKRDLQVLSNPEEGNYNLPILNIGGIDYSITNGTHFPDTIAQIDYFGAKSNESEDNLPEMVINTLHPRIKDMSNFYASDHILAAMAQAAVVHQVSEGMIKPSAAMGIVEKFIREIKSGLFQGKKPE